MATDGSRESDPRPWMRTVKGATPLALVGLFLFASLKNPDPVTGVILVVLSALVLWFGWTSVRQCRGTRWFGILLALYVGSLLGVFAIAIVIRVGLLLFPLLLLAVPLMIYDLLFRAPFKGRFERARAERGHLRSN